MLNLITHPLPFKEWITLSNANDVVVAELNIILSSSKPAIEKSGKFKIVLAGGSTPEQVYRMLAEEDCDWEHWELYLGDERCLPIKNPERNSEMIRRVLFDKINISENNVYFIFKRVSLSASCLSQTWQLLIIITGAGKKAAVGKWRKNTSRYNIITKEHNSFDR